MTLSAARNEPRVTTQPFVFLRGSKPGCKVCRLSAERKSLQHARARTQRTRAPAHTATVLVISHERHVPGHVTQGACTPDKGNSRTEITGSAAFFMVLSFYFLFCVAAFFEESGGPCSEPLSEEAGPPNSLSGNGASYPSHVPALLNAFPTVCSLRLH